jgi:hypothetical protein
MARCMALGDQVLRRHTSRTLELCKGLADRYVKRVIGGVRLDKLTPAHVQRLVMETRNSQTSRGTPPNAATLRHVYKLIRDTLGDAYRRQAPKPGLTWAFEIGAGDGNRTRTISLGTGLSCLAGQSMCSSETICGVRECPSLTWEFGFPCHSLTRRVSYVVVVRDGGQHPGSRLRRRLVRCALSCGYREQT